MATDTNEHLRSVAVNTLTQAINAVSNLKNTQPPFSDASSGLTDASNALRAIQKHVQDVKLHG